jgi:hypothetical protein
VSVPRPGGSCRSPVGGTSLVACGMDLATWLFAQPARDGALPVPYAAIAKNVHGGEHFGPAGPGEIRGHHPKPVSFPRSPTTRPPRAAYGSV